MNLKFKRIIIIMTIFLLFLGIYPENYINIWQSENKAQAASIQVKSFADLKLTAESVLLMEQGSGKILESKNAPQRMFPASTTKMMTAVIALEHVDLNERVKVGDEIDAIPKDASIAGLLKNEEYSMKELLTGLLLPSGNDAAYVIATYIGRKTQNQAKSSNLEAISAFVTLMNKKAIEIGCKDTHFSNPDGYHDANHYTTAIDLALIARKALENETFRKIVRLHSYQPQGKIKKSAGSSKLSLPLWTNTNLLLDKNNKKYYNPDVTGVKTGSTSQAGYCLVASGSRNGLNFITVILHSTPSGRLSDTNKVLNYGFEKYKVYSLFKKGQLVTELSIDKESNRQQNTLKALSSLTLTKVLSKQQNDQMIKKFHWNEKLFEFEPNSQKVVKILSDIHKGQVLGNVTLTLENHVIATSELISDKTIQNKINILPEIQLPGIQLPDMQKETPGFLTQNWMLLLIGTIIFFSLLGLIRHKKK